MSYYGSNTPLNQIPSNNIQSTIENFRNSRTGIDQLNGAFKGMSIGSNYSASRDGRVGAPPSSYNPPERSNGYYNAAGYTPYSRGGVYRKSRKMRKSRKSRKNNKRTKRYRRK